MTSAIPHQSTVFNFEPTVDPELCTGTYFTDAIPVVCIACVIFSHGINLGTAQVDLQIAKQGFRLAAWLNVLFDGSAMLP